MNITWVVENNRFEERGYDNLLGILNQLCYRYQDVRVFQGEVVQVHQNYIVPDAQLNPPIVVLGSWNLVLAAIKAGWKPGVFLNSNFRMTEIAKHYEVLNPDFEIRNLLTPGDLPNEFFAKPDNDGKIFAGQVFTWSSFHIMRDKLLGYGVDINVPIIICPIRETLFEYRLFVVDGKIVACSQYKEGLRKVTNPKIPFSVFHFVETQIEKWKPAPCFVIDVALVPEGPTYKVIEVNCINCSGFYDCNVEDIVNALSSYILREEATSGS
jgi:hypothetical protein